MNMHGDHDGPEETTTVSEGGAELRRGPFLAGLALTTGASLALEVLDTRLLSVITWYSLAFLVIAMGLFGLTAGALRVYLNPEEFGPENLAASLSRYAQWFAFAVPASLVLLLVLPLATAPVFTTIVLFVVFSLVLALPFYPAGVVIAAALTRTTLPVGQVYAVDLFGAALGAPLVPWLLRALGGETALLFVGVVAQLASLAFASASRTETKGRSGLWSLAVLVGFVAANAMTSHGLQPIWVKGRPDVQDFDAEMWNSHSRVRAFREIDAPAPLWGGGSRCTPPVITHRIIEIDAAAGTAMYRAPFGIAHLDFLQCDVTDIANLLRPNGPAAIIGVGGSRDIQGALHAGHAPVYGIEFNERILELLEGPLGIPTGVPTDPNVRLVHEEGRSFLSRTHEKFEVIQASLIDTWAATGAGAHALGENGLYTIEAWRTFLDRLTPSGVLTVSRWSQETLRVASLATGTLLSRGVANPRLSMFLVATPMVVTVLVSPTQFSAEDVARIHGIADEEGFFVLAAPGEPAINEPIASVVDAKTQAELDRATYTPFADFRPPTDDRPYFFNVLPVESAWRPVPPVANMGVIEGNLLATRTLVLAFLASVLLVTVAILLPLWRRARPQGSGGAPLYAGLAYFTLIGVGFMIAEMTLLQRLSLVLGNPSYSLIVVVTSLVASTGLGSLVSDRLPLTRAPYCYIYPTLIAVLLALCAVLWPSFAVRVIGAGLVTRIVCAVLLTASLGVFFGVAFPTGLRFAKVKNPDEGPWFWGMNGVGSVLSSSLAVILAERYGLRAATLFGAGAYALLLIPIAVLKRSSAPARS
jgi:hypothetical protein